MYFLIWLFVGFITFFFMYKKNWERLKEKAKSSYDAAHLEFAEGWKIYILPIFWPIGLPGLFMWRLLEKLFKL